MKKEEFINMCKRMVVEYYNRYVLMIDNPTITVDNVNLIEFENSEDYIQEALLMVDIDPWLQYKVIYNQNAKNKKDQKELISYTIYT